MLLYLRYYIYLIAVTSNFAGRDFTQRKTQHMVHLY